MKKNKEVCVLGEAERTQQDMENGNDARIVRRQAFNVRAS
jgi:hypothetical protein